MRAFTQERLPRLFFHLAFASIVLFGPGLFLTWALALVVMLTQVDHPEFQLWKRRLLYLAVVDTVLVASMMGLMAGKAFKDSSALGAPASRRVIGVALEKGDHAEVRIRSVIPGGPADQAGIRAGDAILEVDGQPVTSVEETRQRVSSAPAGTPVRLQLGRGDERLTLDVTPVPESKLRPPSRGMFEPDAPGQCLPFQSNPTMPWALLFSAVVVIALHAMGRRRGMDATLLSCGLLFLVASVLTQSASILTCLQVGGPSRGGILVALYMQTVALIAGGALLWRRTRKGPVAELSPTLPPGKVFLLGALYLIGGGVRVGAALTIALQALGRGGTPYENSVVHEIATSGLGVHWAIAFVLVVALLGPIGEELLFRGVVLPWMTRWMKPFVAIAVSGTMFGALHLFYGPFVLVAVYYGLVLGWARLRSGGLAAPIALHVGINGTVSAILLWLTSRGG